MRFTYEVLIDDITLSNSAEFVAPVFGTSSQILYTMLTLLASLVMFIFFILDLLDRDVSLYS